MKTHYDSSDHYLHYIDNVKDYQGHEDDPDIRGWDVYTNKDEKIGHVDSMIVDPNEKLVRYLVVELDESVNRHYDRTYRERVDENMRNYYGTEEDRHILVPSGMVAIDDTDNRVIADDRITIDRVASSPRFRSNKTEIFKPGHEIAVARFYSESDDQYRKHYEDEKYHSTNFTEVQTIGDRKFYDTGLFSRSRFARRSRNANSTVAASVDTGAKKV